jgi:hypothetical protein
MTLVVLGVTNMKWKIKQWTGHVKLGTLLETPHRYDNFKTSKWVKLETLLKNPEIKINGNSLETARVQQ